MTRALERILQRYPRPFVTGAELACLLKGTPDSRYGKVKRMLAAGKLLHVKRGLYCLTEEVGYFNKPHPFELAQFIYGPSLVSLESALSYHGLIPEAVYTTTNVTGKRSKTFMTSLGRFYFQHVPLNNLYAETTRMTENGHTFFIAKPWRAICDYVYCYKKDWHSLDPLVNSLRIEVDNLPDLSNEEVQTLDAYYHQQRMRLFLTGVKNEH